MNVLHRLTELPVGHRAVCAAIGMFDGVHLGHQRILGATVEDARAQGALSMAITFDRHPNAVVAPEKTPLLIQSLEQRLRVIGSLGIETAWLIHFDKTFSQKSGESFIRELAANVGRLTSVSIGRNFSFGHKRSGNVALLKTLGGRLGFAVHDLAPVSSGGQMISSTRIRESLRQGNLDEARSMLGRPYSILGRVLKGGQLGQQLGFPTANVDITGLQLPPVGVYAGHAKALGHAYRAVANLGYRPTLSQPKPALTFEVHLLEFAGDLYDKELEFTFIGKVREERKFPSLEALKQQIQKDLETAHRLLAKAS